MNISNEMPVHNLNRTFELPKFVSIMVSMCGEGQLM